MWVVHAHQLAPLLEIAGVGNAEARRHGQTPNVLSYKYFSTAVALAGSSPARAGL